MRKSSYIIFLLLFNGCSTSVSSMIEEGSLSERKKILAWENSHIERRIASLDRQYVLVKRELDRPLPPPPALPLPPPPPPPPPTANTVPVHDSLRDKPRGDFFVSVRDKFSAVPNDRFKSEDFRDTEVSENSLWFANNPDNYLFTENTNKKVSLGDVVFVNIKEKLNKEMRRALFRSLPVDKIVKKVEKSSRELASVKINSVKLDSVDPASVEGKGVDPKVELKTMRMEIVENLGDNFLRLVGEKPITYQGRRKVIEVIALVPIKKLDMDNKISSTDFLDFRAWVLR